MPHVEIKYHLSPDPLRPNFNARALMIDLHNRLGQEDTIQKDEIKTTLTEVDQAIVGEKGRNDQANMIRITVSVWDKPGIRTPDVLKGYTDAMANTAKKHVPEGVSCDITAEINLLNSATYTSLIVK